MNHAGGDFNFSFGLSSNSSGARAVSPRYLALPFQAQLVGKEALVIPATGQASVRLPVSHARLLSVCDRLRTLEQHAVNALRKWSLPPDQQPVLHRGLADLVGQGLLIGEDLLARRIKSPRLGPEFSPVEKLILCIRTCERPDQLERLLAQLPSHTGDFEHVQVLVLDDSRKPGCVQRNADVIQRCGSGNGLRLIHIDRGRRRRLAARIAAACACSEEALVGLIEGSPENAEPSYGSGFNLALLICAGKRFLMLDDDVSLDAHVIDQRRGCVRLTERHRYLTRFPDPSESETAQFQSAGVAPLRAHAELLGRQAADFETFPGYDQGVFLGDVSPQMIRDLTKNAAVRVTINGTLGDAGTGSMSSVFMLPPDELAPLAGDEATYRTRLYSRRLARCTDDLQLASTHALMTTTLTGIDNRELLLPTIAKGRGEDMVFAACLRHLHPSTLMASLPWMLGHRLTDPRRWSDSDLDKGMTVNPATFLAAEIDQLVGLSLAENPEARASLLREWFGNVAAMTTTALSQELRRQILDYRSRLAGMIAETGQQLNPPAWMKRDFETLINRHTTAEDWDEQRLLAMARDIQAQAQLLHAGMPAWISAWRWCAETDRDHLLEPGAI